MVKICDGKCNECPIVNHPNNRMVTKIMNDAYNAFGNDFYKIVESNCPNLTCCYDCRVDDFCHVENCDIVNGNFERTGE